MHLFAKFWQIGLKWHDDILKPLVLFLLTQTGASIHEYNIVAISLEVFYDIVLANFRTASLSLAILIAVSYLINGTGNDILLG